MTQHTPGPWEIHWYHCRMDASDVEHAKANGNLSAKVGDVLWRAPRSIGPCEIDHSHWGGNLLTVEDADAYLIAAAPELLAALKGVLLACSDPDNYPEEFARARAAIRKAEGK